MERVLIFPDQMPHCKDLAIQHPMLQRVEFAALQVLIYSEKHCEYCRTVEKRVKLTAVKRSRENYSEAGWVEKWCTRDWYRGTYGSSKCHIRRVYSRFQSTTRNHLLNLIELKIRKVIFNFWWHPNCWKISHTRGKHLLRTKNSSISNRKINKELKKETKNPLYTIYLLLYRFCLTSLPKRLSMLKSSLGFTAVSFMDRNCRLWTYIGHN